MANKVRPVRPHSCNPKDIWGDSFDNFTIEDNMKMESYAKEIEPLKEEVLTMLLDNSTNLAKKITLIDVVERLGFSYYYENEINELLDQMFKEFTKFGMDEDLYETSVQFRIFRQHGYMIPCDVFKKFTNSEGKFKETLKSDVRSMISLYEATFLRVHGEDILEQAVDFTTNFLKSIATSSEEARLALTQPLHRSFQRAQARRFIFFYEKDETHNELLLKFAKIEYNRLQLLHRQELSIFQKWWKSFDFAKKLPYVRQRSLECHLWAIIFYHEPKYSWARILLAKFLIYLTVIDDTYDSYGFFEELQPLTEAFERWDLSLMDQFPEEYMKIVYEFVVKTCDEFIEEMAKRRKMFAGLNLKDRLMLTVRNYLIEIKWAEFKYVPTFDEYMAVGRITSGVQSCVTASLLGMEEIAEEKPYVQIRQVPKAIEACEYIVRLLDDIVTHEEELARGCRSASSVECYMKEYNKSTKEVEQIFNKKMDDAWKDMVQEGLLINPARDNYDHFSKPVFNRILNYARSVEHMYKVVDGFTYSKDFLIELVLGTYSQPFSI